MTEGEAADADGPARMQDFIFARELSEVYLLLDHVSGRADKSLADAGVNAPEEWIEQICRIGWPPEGTRMEQAAQAATLLRAKDKLNAAAKPASGATIAFTVLVAGEDNVPGPDATLWQRARSRLWSAGTTGAPPPVLPRGPGWGATPPSRTSLSRMAFPGLVAAALRFRVWIRIIIVLLVLWLALTCFLSWNIATGHGILLRVQALETQRTDIAKKIADAENGDIRRPEAAPALAPGAVAAPAAAAGPVMRYCDRPRRLDSVPAKSGPPIEQFDSIAQLQLCEEREANHRLRMITDEDLADWLAIWRWLRGAAHRFCGGRCVSADQAPAASSEGQTNEQWASILAELLGNAVLPVFYGILGAGAAVVRDLWGKMRDSLLSPRDLTLAFGQLALGAVIGACIGLFVTPSGASAPGGPGLIGAVTLSASALSFVAGFGVEGVFVALESLIKRVFNIGEPAKKA